MKFQRLPRYRVAIPLSSRCVHVVAECPEDAVRVALDDSGMLEGRTVKVSKEGVNWTFYKIDPPLPASWLGEADVPPSPVNPKKGVVACIETEFKGEMLVSVPSGERNE